MKKLILLFLLISFNGYAQESETKPKINRLTCFSATIMVYDDFISDSYESSNDKYYVTSVIDNKQYTINGMCILEKDAIIPEKFRPNRRYKYE